MRHLLPITLILLSNALSGQSNVKLAEHLYRAEQWEKAKALYQNITQENPYNGTYWYRLGYSALKIQDYDQAISAFEKSTGLFSHPSNTYYNLACAYALQGNKARALDYLEKAWWTGFNDAEWIKQDTDLKILHGEKRFLELTGQAEIENLTGTSAWRKDLEYLVEQFEKGHPFLFHSITKEEWETRKSELFEKLADLEDYAIIFELMRLVACVQDGHSNLFPITPGKTYFHYLPFSIDLFKDGLFVTSAKEEYQHLVGAKILKAGYKTAEEFLEESYQYIGADNLMQKQAMFGLITRISEFYKMASISNDIASIPFLFELENGEQQWVNINGSEPTPAFSPHPLDQHMYHPEGNNKGHKAPAKKNYWFEYQKEHKQVYFQYNQVEDHPHGESLAEFSERLFKFIEKENVERLIIDVRHNSGGNNFLNIPVVTGVLAAAKINQKGKLFTLIGRNTFSAAMNFASEMEKYTQTLFVGEPTGSSPNNYGEHNGFRLPYSGLYGSYSSLYFQGGRDSNDKRPWIAPDILAIPTYEEYKQGHDPAIEAILDY